MPRNQSENDPLRRYNVPEVLHPVFYCDARRALELRYSPEDVEANLVLDYVNASAHHFRDREVGQAWTSWIVRKPYPTPRTIVARLMEQMIAEKQKRKEANSSRI